MRLIATKVKFSDFLNQVYNECQKKFLAFLKEELEKALIEFRDQEIIGTPRYHRGNIRKRWGFRIRKVIETPIGFLENVRIPRVRNAYQEICLFTDRYVKRFDLLKEAMLEMYISGMSTRRISALSRKLFSTGLSASCISHLKDFVEEQLKKMRQSKIESDIRILVVDGVYGRFRLSKRKGVCLVAIGVDFSGKAHLLDWLGCESESRANWRKLFRRLKQRGLWQVELLVSDDARGAVGAYQDVWTNSSAHQLCLWHFQRELYQKLHDRSWRKRMQFHKQYWEIFAPDEKEECNRRAEHFIRTWEDEKDMIDCFHRNWSKLTVYLDYPEQWRYRIRTVNLAENFFSHFQTFLKRFPGWLDKSHIEILLALYVKSRKVFRINKDEFYKQEIPTYIINFNTIT